MSHQIKSNLLVELSTEKQQFLVGGQNQPPRPPSAPNGETQETTQPTGQGAYGYIVPDDSPYYYWWRLNRENL